MHKNLAILTLTVIAALLLCGAVSAESVENNVGNVQNPEISTEINEIPTQLNEEVTNPSNQEQTENPSTVDTVNQNEQISSSPNLQDNNQETSKDSVDTVTIQESTGENPVVTEDQKTDIQETQQENTVGTEQNTNSQDTNSASNESLANEYTTYHVYAGQSIQDAVNNAKPGDTIIIHEGVYNEPVNVYSPISIKLAEGENVILADPTWHVYPGQSIQTTINGALAGDTIIVHAGTYNENLSINKSNLTLQAAPGETVTVRPGTGIGFLIQGVSNITIDRFTILGTTTNGGWGILAQAYSNNCTITNNFIGNINVGISFAGTNNTFTNNTINNTFTGININNVVPGGNVTAYGNTVNIVISNNNIENVNNGILTTGLTNFVISNNNITTIDAATGSILGLSVTINSFLANQNNVINNNIITGTNKANPTNTAGLKISNSGASTLTNHNLQIYSNSITNYVRGIQITGYRTANGLGITDIYLNRIYNNLIGISFNNSAVGTTITGTINAINNWWGKNTEPTISIGSIEPTTATDIWKTTLGTLNYNPWLVLNATANPTSIFTGETSTITADLTKNSNGQDTTTIYPGKFVPNGIPVTFEVLDALGTVNPINTNITNGTANTTFTAGSVPGISTIVAKVDGMDGTTPAKTVNTTVEILQQTADISVTKDFFYEDLGTISFPDNPLDRYWKFFSEVVVTNNGPDTATNVKITDLLSPGLELAPFDPFGSWFVTYTGQDPDADPPENNPSFDPLTMIWTIPSMNIGDIWVLDFFTVANTTGIVNNTATFDPSTADQYDPNTTNNVGFVETYVPTAQTQLTKWFQNDSTYGSPHTTTAYYLDNLYAFIQLYNNGPDTAKYITIIDDFSNDLIYDSALMETSYDGGLTWGTDPNAYWLDFGTYSELEWFPSDILSNGMALFRIPGQVNVSNTTVTNNATETQRTFNPDGNNTDNPPINQPGFNTINGSTTLNIPLTPTAITVKSMTGYNGDTVNLTATLTDTHNNVPVSGKIINFTVNGNSVGNATTDASGMATLTYKIVQDAGSYTILAEFLGDANYQASSNTGTLTVKPIPVTIDIKPGETPNSININSNGVIPVAILTTSTFDARTVNPSTVTFGHSGTEKSLVKWTWTDVNGDGKLDLLLYFDTKKTKLLASDKEAILKGLTTGGLTFEGRDSIKTVPK